MIIINTSFHFDDDVENDFIEYMLNIFIPVSTKSGLLTSPRLAQVFANDDDKGLSYTIEFTTKDLYSLDKWRKEECGPIYKNLTNHFREKIIGFQTVLQTIDY